MSRKEAIAVCPPADTTALDLPVSATDVAVAVAVVVDGVLTCAAASVSRRVRAASSASSASNTASWREERKAWTSLMWRQRDDAG